MSGILRVAIAGEHTIRITFDGLKTDQQKITDTLLQGGVAIPGKPEPIVETPFSYN